MGGSLTKVDIGLGRGWLAPAPAASLRRIDAQLGRPAGINEAGRSPEQANENRRKWLAYERYLNGGPWAPKASFALGADRSVHCWGYAADSNDWYNAHAAAVWREHGWRQTARYPGNKAKDEPWHGEYSLSLDTHRNDPVLSGGSITAPRPLPIGDETMFIRALSAGAWARKGVIYSNDMQGHWRGLSNLEGNGYVLPLVEQGKLPFAEFNGTDLDLLFSLNGVWEQVTINPNTSPKWGAGSPLIGLGPLTGKLIYPGTTDWQYPISQTPPDVHLVDDDA